ncbi:MAG: family 43 glycosylhydrolase, partial [Parasporobacterium sp.]|nr:family 43 glycosylhydrolase [Parasporobacterium sp.]
MKLNEINIRDPYILPHDGKYYLYGTRSDTCWGKAEGFDCYVSSDLDDWEGPFEIFKREEDFFADQNFWAPECYYYGGEFCLLATLGNEEKGKSINLLKSDSPTGP